MRRCHARPVRGCRACPVRRFRACPVRGCRARPVHEWRASPVSGFRAHRPDHVCGTATEHSLSQQNPHVSRTHALLRASEHPCPAHSSITTWALCRDKEPKVSVAIEKPKWAVAHCFCSSLPLQFFPRISSNPTVSMKFIQTVKGSGNVNTALEQSRN